jgi:hypothetical protein
MGHQIENQTSAGDCRLTQCSCGRSALQMGKRTFLLSAREVGQMAAVFGYLRKDSPAALETPAMELNRITGEKKWADFSPHD